MNIPEMITYLTLGYLSFVFVVLYVLSRGTYLINEGYGKRIDVDKKEEKIEYPKAA